MPLDEAADKLSVSFDAFGMRIDSAEAKLKSLLSLLLVQDYGKFLPTTGPGGFDPNRVGRLGFAQIGGDLANPLNALASIITRLDATGALDDPQKLAQIAAAIGQSRGDFSLSFKNRDELVDFLTRIVRNKERPDFVEALRKAFSEIFA